MSFVDNVQTYIDLWTDNLKPHPLNEGKFGMDLAFMLAFDLGYLLVVFVGYVVMKRMSSGFNLKSFKTFHNLVLFSLSLYMCLETIHQAILGGYVLFGNPMEKGNEPHAEGMAHIIWIFYLSKSYEFLDTVIMLLTQKFKQVSFLHVYHHSTIFAIWYMIAKYAPGGDAYFSVILNSFVHVVMYFYYLTTGLGFDFMRSIKKYITAMQMTQFVCMFVQSLYDQLYPPDYPKCIVKVLSFYMITLLALFGNFFVQSYMNKSKRVEKKSA